MPAQSQPYIGPCCVLTSEEANEVIYLLAHMRLSMMPATDILTLHDALRAKCRACVDSDPRWRTPLR